MTLRQLSASTPEQRPSRAVRAGVALGTKVEAGDLAGWYHDRERIADTGQPLHFAESGIVISERLHCGSRAGEAKSVSWSDRFVPTERFCDRIKPAGEGRTRGTAETDGADNGEKSARPFGFLNRRAPNADPGSTDARHRPSPVSTPDRLPGRKTELLLSDQEALSRHAAFQHDLRQHLAAQRKRAASRPSCARKTERILNLSAKI